MQRNLLIGLVILLFPACAGNNPPKEKTPAKPNYAGIYSYEKDSTKGGGTITVYPESDSTFLFYIDINLGAPSYNGGNLYGRVKITQDTGTFFTKFDYMDNSCKWQFKFNDSSLSIKTVEDQYDCGFGNGVIADGDYKKDSSIIKQYFENGEGRKIYFDSTKPADYYKGE